MITYLKTKRPIAGPKNYSATNWKSSTVTLSDIFLGDSRNKLADAVHNTSDDDLVDACGATNRLMMMYRLDKQTTLSKGCADPAINQEIDHYQIMKNLMENELCIRLRSGRVCRLVLAQTETD